MAVSPIHADRSAAGDREVSEATDRESQDLGRSEVQRASSSGSARSQGTLGGSLVASVSTP